MGDPGQSLLQGLSVEQTPEEGDSFEDVRRRQEEISNYLAVALDDFNYEESTINSSANMSADDQPGPSGVQPAPRVREPVIYDPCSDDCAQVRVILDKTPPPISPQEKFLNASKENQMKILYEVRVREVEALKQDLYNLKKHADAKIEAQTRQYMISEDEKNKLLISLRECNELLTNQKEEIRDLRHQLAASEKQVDELSGRVRILSTEDEKNKSIINELHHKIRLLEKGNPLKCTTAQEQVLESSKKRIEELEKQLEASNRHKKATDDKRKSLEKDVKLLLKEKEEIINDKYETISSLTNSLEDAQLQCRELINIAEDVTKENTRLKEELEKVTGQGCNQGQMNILIESINSQKRILTDKDTRIKNLTEQLKNLEVAEQEARKKSEAHTEFQHSIELQLEQAQNEISDLQVALSQAKQDHNMKDAEISTLKQLLEDTNQKLEETNEKLKVHEKAVAEKEDKFGKVKDSLGDAYEHINKLTKELKEMQQYVKSTPNKYEVKYKTKALAEELETAIMTIQVHRDAEKDLHSKLATLQADLRTSQEEVESYRKRCLAFKEREELLKELQQKASKFEEVVKREQQRKMVNVGTNVSVVMDQPSTSRMSSIMTHECKCIIETEVVKREVEIYERLQKEFMKKVEKIENSYKAALELAQQNEVVEEQRNIIDKLKNDHSKDRQVLSKMLQEWSVKVMELEEQTKQLRDQLRYLSVELKSSQESEEKLKALVDRFKAEQAESALQKTIEHWKAVTNEFGNVYSVKLKNIVESRDRILKFLEKSDAEIVKIKREYKKIRSSVDESLL